MRYQTGGKIKTPAVIMLDNICTRPIQSIDYCPKRPTETQTFKFNIKIEDIDHDKLKEETEKYKKRLELR